MKGPYDDIIALPHPTSRRHPRMPAIDRAAQFAPFAALTGYAAAVKETARETEAFTELAEDEAAALDRQLRLLEERVRERPWVVLTCFQPDQRKAGGAYLLVLLLAVLGGGGAFAYIKFIKPKQGAKVSADPDDYDFEDEEEYINEDAPEPEETEETK